MTQNTPHVTVGADPVPRDPAWDVSATVTGSDASTTLRVTRQMEHDDEGADVLIQPVGVVDIQTVGLLRDALLDAVEHHPRVCCDLSGVTFFSAAGASALIAANNAAARGGCAFAVRGAHGTTRRILQITRLDLILTFRA